MLELRTLGQLSLRGPDGGGPGEVLAQPKRLALLIYLVAGWPRRHHRRDTLLALFWPELDEPHARAALRRAVHFLRARLGPEVIAGRGEEELAVADQLWCDASAFDAALAAGAAEAALELYGGDLLEGFHVASAPGFQDWLDRERNRLRERAAGAAGALAQRAEREGRPAEAAGWARRALALAPDDEAALRRALALLDRAGDRLGALRAYDEFAARLAAAYDIQPSPESRAAVERIRAALPRAAEPPVAGVRDAGPVAIFPFEVRGDAAVQYLRDGMVDLLATQLDGPALRVVDPRALLGQLARTPPVAFTPPAAGTIAAGFGAGRFILGSVVAAGGRLQAGATLYRAGGTVEGSFSAAADGEAGLFRVVDDLARGILGGMPGTRVSRLATRTTTSLPALKAYLGGEALLRAGRYFDALDQFQQAVTADDTFALAHYRLAAAAAGCALPELARAANGTGARHRQRLSGPDRLLFDAQRAWLAGEVGTAEAHYGTITGTHPDDVEAWFHLGDLLFHSNPLRGRSATEARVPFERALELEPDHVASATHLARIAALEGRTADALRYAGRVVELSPGSDQALAMRAFSAWTRRDRAATALVGEELQRARAVTVAVAFSDVALYSGNLEGAADLARTFLPAARSDEMRALVRVLLAHVLLASGDPRGAWTELEHGLMHDRAWGLAMQGLFAALPFGGASDERARAVHRALADWDAAATAPSSFLVFAMHNGLHPHIRLYLLALLDARLADPAARAVADALWDLPVEPGLAPIAEQLARGAEARVLQAEGRFAEALATLEAGRGEAWFQLTVASPFYSQAYERYLRAALLRSLGRPEAEGWYRSLAQRSPWELIYRGAGSA